MIDNQSPTGRAVACRGIPGWPAHRGSRPCSAPRCGSVARRQPSGAAAPGISLGSCGEAAAELLAAAGRVRRSVAVRWRGGSRAACGRRPGSAQPWVLWRGGSRAACGRRPCSAQRSEPPPRTFFAKKLRINLVMSAIIRNFALENYGKRAANIHHIKVDWETRQFYVNYRDNLTRPMAGPIPCGTASEPGDYKGR